MSYFETKTITKIFIKNNTIYLLSLQSHCATKFREKYYVICTLPTPFLLHQYSFDCNYLVQQTIHHIPNTQY